MNKRLTKIIFGFFLSSFAIFSLSCGRSTTIDSLPSENMSLPQPSQTPVLSSTTTIPTVTEISLTCISAPQESITEFQKIAKDWFQSPQMLILDRNQYKANTDWENFCQRYQDAILNEDSWVNYPIEIALNFSGYPNPDDFPPYTVTSIFKRGDSKIVTVVTLFTNLLDDSVRDVETRVDLIKENEIWQIQWSGYRLRCYRNNSEEWVITPCP